MTGSLERVSFGNKDSEETVQKWYEEVYILYIFINVMPRRKNRSSLFTDDMLPNIVPGTNYKIILMRKKYEIDALSR